MIKLIIFCVTTILSFSLASQEVPSKVEYILTDKIGIHSFNQNSIDKIKEIVKKKKFEVIDHHGKDKLNINYNDQSLIFKITVGDNERKDGIFVDALSVGYVYILDENFKVIDNFGLGRNSDNFYPIFQQTESKTYYVLREGSMRFDGKVRFITESESFKMNTLNNIIIILFLGSILYLALYHLGYYCVTKNVNYLYYICFNLSYTVIVLTFGYFFNYFAHNMIYEELLMTYAAISAFFLSKFARSFLDFKTFCKKPNLNLILTLEYSLLFLGVIHPFLPSNLKPIGASVIDFFVVVSIFNIAKDAFLIRKKNPLVKFYLLGWLFTYTGVFFLYAYEYVSLFSEYSIVRYSLLIGCFFEMIINSFGLAYQHKQIMVDKTKATLEALDKKRYQNAVKMLIHDIANPLTLSIMALESMKMKVTPLKDNLLDKMLLNITKANFKIKTIIEDTKSYEQNYENDTNFSSNAIAVFNDLNEMFVNQLKEKNLLFSFSGSKDLVIPLKSSLLVNNILGNFLSNSIKFSEKDSNILLSMEKENRKVIIRIKDHGCGMSPEQLELIKNKVMTSSLGTNNEKGTGFGMQIASTLIKEFNGELDITSEQSGPNKGTTFTVSFNSI